MRALALLSLSLLACGGAPFTLAGEDPPDAPLAELREAGVSTPDAGPGGGYRRRE